ncbi:uncharacterized protein LOC142426523 [Tenrec ecaudatus]|uniref:uncharacterized protein LOC142426523 n=1 Tax=Tenrec ecaudatus TaxID=94439 RepID=UPI003F5A04D2
MRRPPPPTATLACAKASPRPLPRCARGLSSCGIHRPGQQRAATGQGSVPAAQQLRARRRPARQHRRPLPSAGRSLWGRELLGSPLPREPPPWNAVFCRPPGNGPVHAGPAHGPKEHKDWGCEAGSLLLFRGGRCSCCCCCCCSGNPAAHVRPARLQLATGSPPAAPPHAPQRSPISRRGVPDRKYAAESLTTTRPPYQRLFSHKLQIHSLPASSLPQQNLLLAFASQL